ncbi:MAG: PQQ-binding-like beta-propeller repeat protein [Pirellulaceae bacterium]|nr:PQQ-binding-like beta-propeller repeat protein [Pirellulaceae bacterium]
MILKPFGAVAAFSLMLFAWPIVLDGHQASSLQREQARRILDAAGVRGGLVVHLGCGDGKLTAALRADDGYLVQGLDADEANVEEARAHIRSLDLYGPVTAIRSSGKRLPYADNLVNLLVVSDSGVQLSGDEVARVLAPDGVALINDDSGITDTRHLTPETSSRLAGWSKFTKPRPDTIDQWTHYLHDASGNAVADDSLVGPPRHLQWVARPLFCRSHEMDSSVSALVSSGGRIFYILDEGLTGILDKRLPSRWFLVARDAFSGVLLWKCPLPEWGWRQWKKSDLESKDWWRLGAQRLQSPVVLPRRLVAAGDRVYATLGFRSPLSVLDAASGEELDTFDNTKGTDEILHRDDVLVLCIREIPATGFERNQGKAASETVVAIRADTGELLWRKDAEKILPLTLAVGGNRVCFHTYDALVCVDLETGKELWRAESTAAGAGRWGKWVTSNTVVALEQVILSLNPKELRAYSADTGDVLWNAPSPSGCGAATPPDLFVASGLVWSGGPAQNFSMRDPRNVLINGLEETLVSKEGRDPLTGEVKRTVTVRNLIDFGHHFRCYRSKATERYLLWPKRGVEFLDLEGTDFDRCDWLRAPCRLGIMPADGLLYVPPHQCFCYPGVLLNGFNALAPERRSKSREVEESKSGTDSRLEKGPAYQQIDNRQSATANPNDWPTYRHDVKRSGSTSTEVPGNVQVAWTTEVGGRLTAPVVACGKVFVGAVDSQTVHCFDAAGGEPLWSYTTGGRVDSPPTICTFVVPPSGGADEVDDDTAHRRRPPEGGTTNSLCLFGSADGWVYCLRASDGRLVWRFQAAPSDRQLIMYDQVTSAWPVHGSVLVEDGVAYFAAGYSSFLDGGVYVYGLDARTGEKLHEAHLEGPYPEIPDKPGWAFDMEGARPEVLLSQNGYIYMRQIKFDKRLQCQETPRITRMGDRDVGLHLFSTSGLLDDSGYNRTFWMYSARWPGYYRANEGPPKTGQLLVFDDSTTYGIKVYDKKDVRRPWNVPGDGYELFADDNDNEPVLDEKAANWDKGPGFTRAKPAKWTRNIPVRACALVQAGDKLFLAGPPDIVDVDDPLASFEGRKGGTLWTVSTSDGEKLAECDLDSPPVLDGLIAARGRLYLCTKHGSVICLQGR